MHVQNVEVSFSRQVKPADYENATASVRLSAALDEGADYAACTDQLLALCKEKALAALGKRTAATAAPAAQPVTDTTAADASKAAFAAKAAAETAKPAEVKKPTVPKGQKTNGATPPTAAAPATVEDDLADILGVEEKPREIKDEELAKAVTKVNAKLKDPAKIRGLISKYTGQACPPSQNKDIPQAKRADYLKELEALAP